MPLFDTTTLLAYLATATVLVLVPGPGTAWIVAQSVAGGTRRGLVAGLGLETATLIHAAAAGLGLSALLATSALAYEMLRWVGAVYLVWLGIKAWRDGTRPRDVARATAGGAGSAASLYLRSVATGVLNPKVALFFVAFLPQFVHPERGWAWLQFLVLGLLLSVIGFTNSCVLALAAGGVRSRVASRPALVLWRQRAMGALFIALGLRLALQPRG